MAITRCVIEMSFVDHRSRGSMAARCLPRKARA